MSILVLYIFCCYKNERKKKDWHTDMQNSNYSKWYWKRPSGSGACLACGRCWVRISTGATYCSDLVFLKMMYYMRMLDSDTYYTHSMHKKKMRKNNFSKINMWQCCCMFYFLMIRHASCTKCLLHLLGVRDNLVQLAEYDHFKVSYFF